MMRQSDTQTDNMLVLCCVDKWILPYYVSVLGNFSGGKFGNSLYFAKARRRATYLMMQNFEDSQNETKYLCKKFKFVV